MSWKEEQIRIALGRARRHTTAAERHIVVVQERLGEDIDRANAIHLAKAHLQKALGALSNAQIHIEPKSKDPPDA